jgi:predicted porin
MSKPHAAALVLALGAASAFAEPTVTVYGRVDLSLAQQADASANKEIKNGSGSRVGLKGVEDLGGGLKAFFHLEHRFNADDGSASTVRFWEGKSIVGLEGRYGRFALGRDENPAYTFSQGVADPWGTDTVASNATIVNGRIGSTRYSNSVNYRLSAGSFKFGAQFAEGEGNAPSGGGLEDRPYSLGLAYGSGPWLLGLGYENPADADDHWFTANASYNFGAVRFGALYGTGKNVNAQKHQSYLLSATAPFGRGEFRASYGLLENKDVAANGVLDKQFGVGYHYALSKRTTLYTDLVHEKRDNLPGDRKSAGYDLGIKHSF